MPRQRRRVSSTGIYHVMIRGNEKKNIFLDNEDRLKFLNFLWEKKKANEYKLFAYCLMDNHIHLLIKEEKDRLSRIMKRINTGYAYYYNQKTQRVGHVFQDRYKSEEIESEGYLLEAVRYIHNNPVNGNLVKDASQYKWSSYLFYLNIGNENNNLTDKKEILEIFSNNEEHAVQLLIEHTREKNNNNFMDIEEASTKEEIEAKARSLIADYFKLSKKNIKVSELKYHKEIRNELIKELKEQLHLTVRQIADILEVNRNVVQRVSRNVPK